MFYLSKYTYKFSGYYKKLKLIILRLLSNFFGFHNYIILMQYDLRCFSNIFKNNSRLKNSATIQSTSFFQYKIYYQNSDFRLTLNQIGMKKQQEFLRFTKPQIYLPSKIFMISVLIMDYILYPS